MLRTGQQYLDSIRDGRIIYIGDERVDDATEHPAFRDIARTYSELYDLKAAPKTVTYCRTKRMASATRCITSDRARRRT